MTIREAMNGHRNSLGIIRLVLAACVIVDHAFPLGGWGEAPFLAMTRGQQSLGGLAVLGFFAISGYLVAKSAQTADTVQFLWRRALRIFPGFWLALLVGVLIVGPIFWVLEGNALGTYFAAGGGGPLDYILVNAGLHIRQFGIWDIWGSTTPYGLSGAGPVINGSIWTLVHEFTCYLILAAMLLAGIVTRAKILVPAVAGIFLLLQIMNLMQTGSALEIIPVFGEYWRANFGFIFFVGATLAVYSDRIPFSNRLGVAAAIISLTTLRFGGFNTFGYIAFAYLMLYMAARLPVVLQRVGARNDYSYGVYLYGWIAEQVLAYFGVYRLGYVPYVLLSLLLASAAAVVSWHLVEKQALKLKDWGPGWGVADLRRRLAELTDRRRTRTRDPEPAAEPGS